MMCVACLLIRTLFAFGYWSFLCCFVMGSDVFSPWSG